MTTPRPTLIACALVFAFGTLSAPGTEAAKRRAAAPARAPAPPALTACSDFYTFTHKAWLDSAGTSANTGMSSAMAQLVQTARQQQIDLLNSYMAGAQGGVPKLLGDFWASGLDDAAVEADGANAIAPLLGRINAIRRNRDIAPAIAALHQVGIPVAFNFDANVDLNDLNRHIGYFTQGGLGLADPAWYTRTDAESRALFERYRKYVKQILILTGTAADKADAETAAVIELETRIAGLSRAPSLLRDPRNNYALVPTGNLAKQFRNLQLGEFLKAQAVNDDVVSLADANYFTQLDTLVGGLKADQWKSYLRYSVGAAMAPYLSRTWREADFDFRGRVLRGQVGPGTRQDQVLNAINLAAGPMLGREYISRHLPAATRQRAEQVAEQVKQALLRGLDRNSWMAPTTKAEAKAKVEALKIELGAPRRDLDYSVQPMGRGSFGSNMLIASTWRHREEMRRIGRGNAERRWDVLPQEPALAYDIAQNRLVITAAMLQAPVLDMARDPAAHYGSFGALVGHELTMAITPPGTGVDAKGQLRNWWTPQDTQAWDALGARLVTQFSAYPFPDSHGLQVNGQLTRTQNMADLSGLQLAADALQTAQPGMLPSAFFEGWAQLWPQKLSLDTAQLLASTDVHAPGQWRTNGPLQHLPEFASAYGCQVGNAMLPPKDVAPVRIW